jgi:hypothetical protein
MLREKPMHQGLLASGPLHFLRSGGEYLSGKK